MDRYIGARPAEDQVITKTAAQAVVSVAARKRVVPRPPIDRIGKGRGRQNAIGSLIGTDQIIFGRPQHKIADFGLHNLDHDADGLLNFGRPVADGHRHVKAVVTIRIARRLELGVVKEPQCAGRGVKDEQTGVRAAHDGKADRIAVHVDGCNGRCQPCPFTDLHCRAGTAPVRGDPRRVIHAGNGQRQAAQGAEQAVRNEKLKVQRSGKILRRRARQRPRRREETQPSGQRRAPCPAQLGNQRVTVRVAEGIGRQGDRKGRILDPGKIRDIGDHRRIVHRGHFDENPRRRGGIRGIPQFIVEPGRPVEARARRDQDLPVARQNDVHPETVKDARQLYCLAVRIEIIGGQRRGEQDQGRALGRGKCVIHRHRRIGGGQHVDADFGRHFEARLVRQGIAQRQGAEIVLVGRHAPLTAGQFFDLDVNAQRGVGYAQENDVRSQRDIVVRHQLFGVKQDRGILDHLIAKIRHRHRHGEQRHHDDRRLTDAGGPEFIGDAVFDAAIAEVSRAALEHCGRAVLIDRAVVGIEDLDDREAVAFHVAVIEQQIGKVDGKGLILGAEEKAIRVGDRGIVDGGDLERDRAGGRQAPIRDHIAKVPRAVDVFIRHQLITPARKFDDPRIRDRALDRHEADRVAVKVGVVGQKIGDGEFKGRILDGLEHIRPGRRRAVRAVHRDFDQPKAFAVDIIRHPVAERGLPFEIGPRREGDGRSVETDRSVYRILHTEEPDGVPVHIDIVQQQQVRRQVNERILVDLDLIRPGGGRIKKRRHVQNDPPLDRAFAPVVQRVDQRVFAREAGQRCIQHRRSGVSVQRDGLHARAGIDPVAVGEGNGKIGLDRQRDISGDRAGCRVEGHPVRQGAAVLQRGRPQPAGQRHHRSGRADDDLRQNHSRAALRGRADLGDAQGIAIVVAVVEQQVGQREGHAAVFGQDHPVGVGDGQFARGRHVEDDNRRCVRCAALFVLGRIGEGDRAVEVARCRQVDPLWQVAHDKAVHVFGVQRGKAVVHHHFGDDRHVGQRTAGNVDAQRHNPDIARGRRALEAKGCGIEGQPAVQRGTAFAGGGQGFRARQVHAELSTGLQRGHPAQNRVDGGQGIRQVGRIDQELQREPAFGAAILQLGQRRGGIGREDDVDAHRLIPGLGRKAGGGKASRRRVEGQPFRQRPPALHRSRKAAGRDVKAGNAVAVVVRRPRERLAQLEIAQNRFGHADACRQKSGIVNRVEEEPERMHRSVRRIVKEDGHFDRRCQTVGDGAGEDHRRGIEGQPVRQGGVVGAQAANCVVLGQEAIGQRAKENRLLEEQHIAFRIGIVSEGFGRDHEQCRPFRTIHQIGAQVRPVVHRQHGDIGRGRVEPAAPVGDGVFEAGRAVEIGAHGEFDQALGIDADLAVLGKAVDLDKGDRVVIDIGVIGQQDRRIDRDHLVLQGAQAVVINRARRQVLRPDVDGKFHRRLGPARVDHIDGDAGFAKGQRGEGDGARVRIEHFLPVGRGKAVGAQVQADKAESVAFHVIDEVHDLIDGEDGGFFQLGRNGPVRNARRVIHRRKVDLDIGRALRAVEVFQNVAEARKTEIIGPRYEFEVLARQLPARVGRLAVILADFGIGPQRVAFGIDQRRRPDDAQTLRRRIAIDVVVIGHQRIQPDAQRLILNPVDQRVVHRHRSVIHRRQVDLDPCGGFAALRIADGVGKEGITVMVLRPEELDHACGIDRHRTELRRLHRHQNQILDPVFGIVLDQEGRVDDKHLVLDPEADDVILGVEAAVAQAGFDGSAVQDRAVGKDDLFDPRCRAEEVVGNHHRIDQEPVGAFQFHQQIVALPQQGHVLGCDAVAQHQAVGVGLGPRFGDGVGTAVLTEDIVVGTGGTLQTVVACAAVEQVGPVAAGQRVGVDRPDHPLDQDQRIARRLARRALAGAKVHRHGGFGGGIVDRVDAAASVQQIGTQPAPEGIVAVVAPQGIGVEAADDRLDRSQSIAVGIAAAGGACHQVDGNAFQRQQVFGGVLTLAAVQVVCTPPAGQRVVAAQTGQRVISAVADQQVRPVVAFQPVRAHAAGQIFDPFQNVARSLAARGRASGQRDVQRRCRKEVGHPVAPGPADQTVGPRATLQRVVACAAVQRVFPAPAFQHVAAIKARQKVGRIIPAQRVVERRSFQRLDRHIEIALCKAALPDLRGKVGPHADVRRAKAHRVGVRAAQNGIGPRPRVDHIIAGSRINGIVARAGLDRIVPCQRDDAVGPVVTFDHLGQAVAFDVVHVRRASQRGTVVIRHRGIGKAGILQPLLVGNAVFDGHGPDMTGFEPHDDELFAREMHHLERTQSHAVALRQFERVQHGIDTDKGRARPVRVVQIDGRLPRAHDVDLFDVEIVEQKVRHADDQRHVQRRDKPEIVIHRRVVVRGHDDDIDQRFDDPVCGIRDVVDKARRLRGIDIGYEQEIPIGVLLDGSVQRPGSGGAELEHVEVGQHPPADNGQRVAVHITVVTQKRAKAQDRRNILGHQELVRSGHRGGIAGRVEIHRHPSAANRPVGISDRITEARHAPIACVGGEQDRLAIDDQFALDRT